MTDTVFVNGTVVQPEWANDVNVATYSQVINLAGLRALSKTRFTKAVVFGATSLGDGGGGLYWYDSSDVTSTDNGGTIIVATDGGVWKKMWLSTIDFSTFGAVADYNGTTGTDNKSVFDAAIASMPTYGGTLIIGPGRFYLATGPTVSALKHITIRGAGSCEAENDLGTTELVIGTGTLTLAAPRCTLESIVIRGKAGHAGDLVQATKRSFRAVDTCFFTAGGNGLRIGDDSGSNCNGWYLDHCRSMNNGLHGYYINSDITPDVNGGVAIGCEGSFNADDGIRFGNAWANTVIGGIYESNGGCGCRMISNAKYNKLLGGDYESNGGTAEISIETGAIDNCIDMTNVGYASISDTGTLTKISAPDFASSTGWFHKGYSQIKMYHDGGANNIISGASSGYIRILQGDDSVTDNNAQLLVSATGTRVGKVGGKISFPGAATPITIPTITGAKGGNAALASLITQLVNLGLVIDSTT